MPEQRFHTPEPVQLEVAVPAGAIEVVTVDGEESVVAIEGSDRLVEHTNVELHGRTLRVVYEAKKLGLLASFGDFTFGNGRLEVRVQVPHRSDVDFKTASADMKVRGRLCSLTTKTVSGDLSVEGEVEREFTVKTTSGDVRVARVGGDLTVQSVSGDVAAQAVGGSVEVKSVSGDVRVDSVREGRVLVQSVSGDIDVGVEPGTNLDVDAGSVSGDLASEVPLGAEPGSGLGEGPTLVVRGKTVSGDFKVRRAR